MKFKDRLLKNKLQKNNSIFASLFISYTTIILLCFILYASILTYKTYKSSVEQTNRENLLVAKEVTNLIDQRLLSAQTIVSNVNSSTVMKDLYMSTLGNNVVVDSFTMYSTINQLKALQISSKRLDIEELVLFVNNYDRAYSYTGVVNLNENFNYTPSKTKLYHSSISEVFGVKTSIKMTFLKKSLMYVDDYTYLNGTSKGAIVILFNEEKFINDMVTVMGEDASFVISDGDKALFTYGDIEGEPFSIISSINEDFEISLYFNQPKISKDLFTTLALFINFGGLLTVLFLILAYYFSKKHYRPIDKIKSLVATNSVNYNDDEMSTIIDSIQKLIGERNDYIEDILTITPYAKQGLLHNTLMGNFEHANLNILSSENNLYLQKPYFIISAINFYDITNKTVTKNLHREIKKALDNIPEVFSTDSVSINIYEKDYENAFLVVNLDEDQPIDDLFFQIHKFLINQINNKDLLVTIGVDDIKDDITMLQEACICALLTLDEMIISGRGDIYFYELSQPKSNIDYYLPVNLKQQLMNAIENEEIETINDIFNEIYEKNMDISNITTISIKTLLDDIYITTVRCVRELPISINLEKTSSKFTLKESIDYYKAVFKLIISRLDMEDAKSDVKLDVIEYINNNLDNAEMSLQFLSNKFNISGKYISQICKKQFDLSYLQYLQHKRVELAIKLIEDDIYSLQEICTKCGYANQITFRRNFKTIVGTNPSEYKTTKK